MSERNLSPLAGVELVRPSSYTERLDVRSALANAGDDSAANLRVFAGAIGVCSERIRRRQPYRGKVFDYGKAVLDSLMTEFEAAGWSEEDALVEIGAAGGKAVRLCSYPTKAAVEAARGNSEAPEGA